VADKNSSTTGSPNVQAPTLDKTNSKDTTTALDKNPSTAPTDSADKSATKDPNSVPSDKAMTASAPHRTSDKEFLVKAAEGGMTEVELGKLAQEKGSSADVKQFGSHMVMDHSKADAQLKEIAAKKGITVPSTLDAKSQATVDHLSSLSGPAFDKAYVHTMVKDHEKDAAEFRAESTSAQDPDVKTFAGDTLKVIETHLSDIKSIQGKMQ
jgi:putative membrane protein